MQSVDRVLQLLCFIVEHQRLSVSEVAQMLGVAPSTASRLVTMLELHGFVEKDQGSRGYVVGTRLREIGYVARKEQGIRAQVRPTLEVLAAETGETAQFGILQGATVVFLDCVEGAGGFSVTSRIAALFPAHAMATGKVLLASLPIAELHLLYPYERLSKSTERTLATRSRLFAELDGVRRNAIAVAKDESEDGIYVLAVPVTDPLGRTWGALSVAGPTPRMAEGNIAFIERVLRREAQRLNVRLV
jgi:IclR family transcriptional regulator, acetate operon repressor